MNNAMTTFKVTDASRLTVFVQASSEKEACEKVYKTHGRQVVGCLFAEPQAELVVQS